MVKPIEHRLGSKPSASAALSADAGTIPLHLATVVGSCMQVCHGTVDLNAGQHKHGQAL